LLPRTLLFDKIAFETLHLGQKKTIKQMFDGFLN